ncbi:isoflavone reductase [Colletotrichum asianum]
MSVLVLGAGELGSAMLKALTSHPSRPNDANISVLLRPSTISSTDPSKSKSVSDIKALGVSVEAGDVVNDSIADLAALFSKYDTVISCTGFVGPTGTQRRICQAALQSSVRRYIPWQFGVDYDVIGRGSPQVLFDEQLDVRDMLRAQTNREWIIISTGLFMSFLFVKEFGVVDFEERKLRALGGWDVEITVTGPEDIARMTAEVVFEPRGIPGNGSNVVFVAGDTISYGRIADLVEKRFNEIEFTREEWGMRLIEASLQKDPGNVWNKYRGIFGAGSGIAWPMEKTLNYQRGIKLEDLEKCLGRMESPAILEADPRRSDDFEYLSVPQPNRGYHSDDEARQKKRTVFVDRKAPEVSAEARRPSPPPRLKRTPAAPYYSHASTRATFMAQKVKLSWPSGSPDKITKLLSSKSNEKDISATVSLFERDYWKRLWVVQEVFNAQSVTVYCGEKSLLWDIYKEASHVFQRHKGDLDYYFPGNSQGRSYARASQNHFTYSQILTYQGPGSLPDVRALRHYGEDSLLEVMRVCRRKFSSDPKDKVFGILGLLTEDVRKDFPVDYGLSVKEIYTNVVDFLISTTGRFDVICEAIHYPPHMNTASLPSWVPDWSHIPDTVALGAMDFEPPFSASQRKEIKFSWKDDRRNKIEITCLEIDTVRTHGIAVGTLCTLADYLMAFIHWRALLLATYKADDLEAQDLFCRALCLNQVPRKWANSFDWVTACFHVFASLIRERLPHLPLDQELEK